MDVLSDQPLIMIMIIASRFVDGEMFWTYSVISLGFSLFFSGLVGKFVSWQLLSGLCIIAPALMAIGLVFMPRSPVFLLSKGKEEEAKKSLRFLRGPNFDINSEMKALEASLEESKAIGSISIVSLLTNRVYLKPFLISMVSGTIFQQTRIFVREIVLVSKTVPA